MTALMEVRDEIAGIDREIMTLIQRRMCLAEKVFEIKQKEGIKIHDSTQNQVVLQRVADIAKGEGLDVASITEIYEIIIRMSIERQYELSKKVADKKI